MKVFFSLIILSLMLATCQGECFTKWLEAEVKDDTLVMPNTCVDGHDQREHLIGSTWNTAGCLRCECRRDDMSCCHRFAGIAKVEGCKTVLNPETCKYEHYSLDDPSQRCGV